MLLVLRGDEIVKVLKPNESLLLVGHDPVIGDTSWSFGLYPLDKEHTRLVTRTRVRWTITLGGIILSYRKTLIMR